MPGKKSYQLILFSALFLLSGAAGLIYEIIWERLLALYFGVTMTSITLIVSAYMAGLGLGSLFGGRIAQKIKSTLIVYGSLEIGIGIFGVISPALLNFIGQSTAGSPSWLVFILSFLFLLAPTFLMGMTLPLLSQTFIDRVETSGQVIGLLYGINTLGAAFGSLFTAYIFIGKYGFDGASYIAVTFNIIVGVVAIIAARWLSTEKLSTISVVSVADKQQKAKWTYREILFASFLVGFIGLGFEMLWIRILHIINKNTSYGFASILFVFLIGLAIGGYYWGRRADKARDPEKLFWQLEVSAGIIASLVFLFFWISIDNNISLAWIKDFWSMQKPASPFVEADNIFVFSRRLAFFSLVNYFLPIVIMVLPTSLLLGGGLPMLDRIAINSPEVAGRRVGDIHLANIIGAVCGSLAISFFLLPTFGTEWTHKILILLGMAFPFLYLMKNRFRADASTRLSADLKTVSVISASVFILFFLPSQGQFYTQLFSSGTNSPALSLESSDTVLALTFDPATQTPNWLWISGETNSFYPSDGTYESRGMLCAGASQPKRILVIGMGGGVAARFFQSIKSADEIIVVELMEDLGGFLDQNVELTKSVFTDPRVHYIVDDGRRYLYANPDEKFDLIFADPLRWYSSGHNNLYSLEAVQLYKDHLAENGVFCAYVDQPHALPLTISKVFSHVDQFGFRAVIASSHEINYDLGYMETIRKDYLAGIGSSFKSANESALEPMELFARFARSREQILSDERKTPILTDTKPALEFYFLNAPDKRPVYPKENARELFLQRITGCDSICQQDILDLAKHP